MPTVWCLEYQLYDFSGIEVATNKLGIRLVFFKGHDGEMIGFHDGVTYRSYPLQKVLRISGIRTGQRFDECNAGVGLLTASVDTLNSNRHIGCLELEYAHGWMQLILRTKQRQVQYLD